MVYINFYGFRSTFYQLGYIIAPHSYAVSLDSMSWYNGLKNAEQVFGLAQL